MEICRQVFDGDINQNRCSSVIFLTLTILAAFGGPFAGTWRLFVETEWLIETH